jgi:hypothetical protein
MQFTKNLSKTHKILTNYFCAIFDVMKFNLKTILAWGGAFVAYRLYKLYELGENIIYKPVGVSFTRGKSINDFVVRVKMELLNPTKTTLPMRGIDGKLKIKDQIVGTFASAPFTIKAGISYFFLDFKIVPDTTGVQIITAILKKQVPVFIVDMNKRLPYFSINEVFAINPNTIETSKDVMVK